MRKEEVVTYSDVSFLITAEEDHEKPPSRLTAAWQRIKPEAYRKYK
jgi:hypothetical protein